MGGRARVHKLTRMSDAADETTPPPATSTPPTDDAAPDDNAPARYNLKADLDTSGAGFNQFDPVLSASQWLSRRFGLAGGLALVALLAATEGREILLATQDTGPAVGDGTVVTTESGLQYVDLLVSKRGDTPLPGAVIGLNAVVSIGDKVLYDTANDKKVAFKYGQRPFQNVVCEGVEEGIKGMRPGSKRKLIVPKALAPAGVDLPGDLKLEYEIELLEVLPGYF